MKRLLNIFLAVVLLCVFAFGLTACVSPDDGADKKEGVLIKKEKGVYVIYDYVDDGKLTDGVLDLSVILQQKGITEAKIKSGAFDGADNIRTLIVPDTIIEIQEGAFRKMSNLYELRVPFIGLSAKADAQYEETDKAEGKAGDNKRTFAHFFGIEEYDGGATLTNEFGTVYVPYTLSTVVVNATANVDYSVEGVKEGYTIPMGAFEGATTLQTISLTGENLKEIGYQAFKGCTGLTTITVPATVKKIYDKAFIGCDNLLEVNVLGTGVQLGEKVFKDCVKMNKLNSQTDLVVNLGAFNVIGNNAFDFGRENVEFTVENKGEFNLTKIFGQTKTK